MLDGKILFADDEKQMRNLVKMYLEKEGFGVDEASDGELAINLAKANNYDLIILDVMMPVQDGLSVCKSIRQFSKVPIIMLTARGDEIDRVLGFELGADDYVIKPFSPRELVARVKALLRRTKEFSALDNTGDALAFKDVLIDISARKVLFKGREISLTPKEFDLLLFLGKNQRKVFTREAILERVWGYDYFGDLRTVDTHIKNLREKLCTGSDKYIHTVWGVGYKFEVT